MRRTGKYATLSGQNANSPSGWISTWRRYRLTSVNPPTSSALAYKIPAPSPNPIPDRMKHYITELPPFGLFLVSHPAQGFQILFTITDRRHPYSALKQRVKIISIIVSSHHCNLCCRQVAGNQPRLRKTDTPPDYILNRGIPARLLKYILDP